MARTQESRVPTPMIRVEQIDGSTYGVVDYISGKREVRFTGSEWLCFSFLVGMVGPLELAQC